MRNPGRTATTAAALMIGLALVTFVTVFAAGFKASIASAIDTNFKSDMTIQNTDGFSPIPNGRSRGREPVQGVGAVSALRYSQAKVDAGEREARLTARRPAHDRRRCSASSGRAGSDATSARLTDDQTVIDEIYGKTDDIDMGDRLNVLTPAGKRHTLRGRRRGQGQAPTSSAIRDHAGRPGALTSTSDQRQLRLIAKCAPGANPDARRRRDQRASSTSASRRRGAQPGGAQERAGGPDQPAARADLRAAVAGGHRLASSASSTRSRSRSTSARASSGCCARSGCRGARSGG